MWGARIQSGPTGYGPGFTVLMRNTPSLPDRIAAKPTKFGSSGAGLRSFGCTYRPKCWLARWSISRREPVCPFHRGHARHLDDVALGVTVDSFTIVRPLGWRVSNPVEKRAQNLIEAFASQFSPLNPDASTIGPHRLNSDLTRRANSSCVSPDGRVTTSSCLL